MLGAGRVWKGPPLGPRRRTVRCWVTPCRERTALPAWPVRHRSRGPRCLRYRPPDVAAGRAVLTLLVAGAAPASASAAEHDSITFQQRIVIPMKSAGFDAKVATANGYEIRTTGSGQQYSVPKGTPRGSEALFDIVNGTCGTSWVFISGIGNAKVQMETGYSVLMNVLSRAWRVVLVDNGGSSTHSFSGGATGAVADWTKVVSGLTRGDAFAVMNNNGTNIAILANGRICRSGGPSDRTIIT